MSKITDYQRHMWTVLTYFTLCKYYIDLDSTGNFVIKKAGKFRQCLYYGIWVNGITKITYLILAYRGYLPVEVHFLDQMGMWDWFLCFSQVVQEANMWYRKYPMFEILHCQWKIQELVYCKLGSPKHVQTQIAKNGRSLVLMHGFIVGAGSLSIWIQFFTFPKYAAYIYALVPWDNWFLRIVFCTHEMIFVFHIWVHQAWSIILCELYANSYTQIMKEMTVVLRRLINLGIRQDRDSDKSSNLHVDGNGTSRCANFKTVIQKRKLDPKQKVPGTEYDILALLQDYKSITLASNAFNGYIGFCMGGTMLSNYSQFVSDVFMMIQLLKEPEMDTLGVFFYAEDAVVGMWMLFKMLIIISRLYPASEEFLQTLKQYLTFSTPLKPYLLKYQKGLRIICTKLGGYKTQPITVPKGVNCLMNWYINAALWKRPVDRRT